MNPVLIAGGDGFIGRAITDELLARGIEVIVLDNHITSFPRKISDPKFYRIIKDVCEIDEMEIPRVSGIIHLASIASPLVYKNDPEKVIQANTIGTQKLIELARRDQVKILFASSSEVYGDIRPETPGEGISESHISRTHLLTSRSCYSTAKKLGEELILNYRRQGGLGTNLRLFNIYGQGMDTKNPGYGRVIPNFIDQVSRGQPVTVFGDGGQVRSFLWIEEAVQGILKLFFDDIPLPPAVNIGNDETIKIIDLAEKIARIIGLPLSVNYFPMDIDDPQWRKPDLQLIKSLIAWKPQVSLEEGLKKIIKEKMDR